MMLLEYGVSNLLQHGKLLDTIGPEINMELKFQ